MKNRLTALFMSAVLALSTFAAVIPTAAASGSESESELIEVGTDVMEEFKPSINAKKVNVEDGNGYLHIYNRYFKLNVPDAKGNDRIWHRLQAALGYQPQTGFTFKNDVLYFVSLKARAANHWATKAEADAKYPSYAGRTQNVTENMYWTLSTTFDQKNISSSQYLGAPWKRNTTLTDFIDPSLLSDANKTALAKHTQDFIVNSQVNESRSGWYENRKNDGSRVILSNDWREFTWAFMPASNTTVNTGIGASVLFGSEGGEYRCIPVDIDDFKIWYYDADGNAVNVIDSSAQTLMGYDFNDVENPPQDYDVIASRIGQLFKANVGWTQDQISGSTIQEGHNGLYSAVNVREYDYYEAKVAQSGSDSSAEIKYTFPNNLVLSPGIYEFTADVRLNFYDGYLDGTELGSDKKVITKHIPQFITDEDNKAKVAIKDNNNNGGEFDITPEWTPVSFTVTVPKESNVILSDITASFTDNTYSANKAYNIRNAKLVKTTDFVYDSEFEGSEADVTYSIEDDVLKITKGAADAKLEMVYPESYVEGNKYLTVTGRTNERDGFILDLRGIIRNSGENDYRLSFKVRASRELSNLKLNSTDPYGYDPSWTMVKLSAGLYRGKYVTAAPSTFQPNGQNKPYYRHRLGTSGAYWWYFDNAEWHTVDIPFNDFVQTEEGVSTRYDVIHFGGAETAYNAVNFDIDDITVYSDSKGEIWKQDFQGQKAGKLSEKLAENFVPFKETWLSDAFRTEEVALSIGEDAQYITASNVKEIKYTVPEHNSITLAPGRYTVHADFSYPYFDGDRITVDVGSARLRNYIKENNNTFDVTAVVETETGKLKLKPCTVDNDWTECKFIFEVEESTSVKSITFTFKDASGAEYTTVCYRNIYIDGYYPEGPGFPNNGIVLMLLLKKKAAVAVEEQKAEADEKRTLSDREVVYPIIDSSFVAVNNGASSKVKTEYPDTFDKGNKYLRVNGRLNNRDGIIIDLRRAILDVSEAEYRLSFKIRSAATISNIWSNNPTSGPFVQKDSIRLGEGLYNGAYTPASPTIFSRATITSAGFDSSINGWYFDNNAWTTVDVAFTELKNQNVIQIGGGALGCNASDFDIDDVMIYVKGEEEPIYLEDFEDAASGELSNNLSYFYVPFKNGNVGDAYRPYGVALEVEEDRSYLTAGGASELKHTAPEGDEITLAAGEYTLHAGFSYPYFNGKSIEIAETADSKKQSYFKSNGNTFDVTAIIETDNGTFTFDKYSVRNSWVDCEFSFKVENDTKIKSVSFKLTPAGEAKSTAVCFRDVYIDGDLAK